MLLSVSEGCSCSNCLSGSVQRYSTDVFEFNNGVIGSVMSLSVAGASYDTAFDSAGKASISVRNNYAGSNIEYTVNCDSINFSFYRSVTDCITSFALETTPTKIADNVSFLVYIYSGVSSPQNYGTFSCSLYITDTNSNNALDYINPQQPSTSPTGMVCRFNFQFTAIGTYIITSFTVETISNTETTRGDPLTVTILSPVTSLTITSSASTATYGALVTYTVSLYSNSQLSTGSNTVTLSLDDNTAMGGDTSKTTSTGTAIFSSSIQSVGLRTVKAKIGSITGTTTMTILAHNFQITALTASNVIPTTSNDIFTITVTASDPSDATIVLPNIDITIYLSSSNGSNSGLKVLIGTTTYTAGTFSGTLVSGTKSWSNVQILSSGVFKFGVTYPSFASTKYALTPLLSIANFIKTIGLSKSYAISNYVAFDLSIDITGTDSNTFKGVRPISVTESSLQGETTTDSVSGKAVWTSLYFSSSGTKTLVFSSGSSFDQFRTLTLIVSTSKLNLLFTSALPTTSASTFSVSVKVTESSKSTTLVKANGLTVTLSLAAQGTTTGTVLSGTATASTLNGEATFSNLQVLSSGSFKLLASTTSDLISGISSAFSVTSTLSSFSYAYPDTISNFFMFSLVITLLGDGNSNYAQSTTVSISHTSGSGNLVGTLSQTAVPTNGQITLPGLYFTALGSHSIQIVVTSSGVTLTQSSTLTVAQCKIIVSFTTMTPALSSDTFNVKVEVKDSTGTNLESMLGVYPISLLLIGSSNSGLVSTGFPGAPQSTTAGQYTFVGLNILSSGTFTIKATSTEDLAQGVSSSFTITNKVISITLTTDPLPTTSNLCGFSLSFKLIGEDNLSYILPASVTLYANTNTIQTGGSAILTPTPSGIITMTGISISFKGSASLYLFMYNGEVSSSSFTIQVDESKLKLSFSAYPTKSTDAIDIQVSFMCSVGVVESNSGPYTIQISISCQSQCSGTSISFQGSSSTGISKTTVAGIASFNSVSVLSSGDFLFIASMSNMLSIQSSVFNVVNYVKTSYVSGLGSLAALSGYTMQVDLYGDDGNQYKLSTTITLTSTPSMTFDALIYSGISISVSQYFRLSGSYTITASTTSDNPSGITKNPYMASVSKARLDIQIQGNPQDTTDTFDIVVTLIDINSNQIANKVPVVFSIAADCGNCIDPAVNPTYTIIYKQTVLYKYKITLTGYHSLTASGSDLISGSVNLNELASGVKAVTLSNVPQEISINTYFTLKLTIASLNNQPVAIEAYYQLTDDFGNSLGSGYYTPSSAFQSHSVYVSTLAATLITATCKGVQTTVAIKVLPLKFAVTLSTTPTTAGDTFDLEFSILNSLGSPETSNIASYYASITLTAPSGANSGLSVKNADTSSFNPLGVIITNRYLSGIANLNDLAIASSGSFVLTVTSNYAQTITPATLNLVIAPKVGSVVLSGPTSPVVYKKYSIIVSIYGVDGNAMKESLAVTLSDGGSFTGNSPITTTTSLATFTVYATQVISITYSASVIFNGVTTASTPASITANVIKASLKAVFNPVNVYVNTAFAMTVTVTDNLGVLIPDIPSASITVSSSGSGFVTTSRSTSQGTAQFSGLMFTAKGNLDIQMNTDTTALISSGTVTAIVTSTLSSITSVYSTTSTSTNFDFTASVSLKDSNGNPYIDDSSIAVTCSNDAASLIVSLVSTGQYKLRFTASGSKTVVVTATSNGAVVTTTDTITITQNKLKFDSISLTSPSTSSTTFGLSVGIYDSTLTNKETTNGVYSVTISIVPRTGETSSGTLISGTLTVSASSGVAVFTNLKILSSGTFMIKAVCSGFVDLLSDSSYVITTRMSSYQLTTTQLTARPYENIIIGFSLKGDDNTPFMLSANFVPSPVPANTNGLSTPIESSNGVFTITFYSTAVQTFSLQGSFTSGGQSLPITAISISIVTGTLKTNFDTTPVNQRSVFSLIISTVNALNQVIAGFPSFTITIQLRNNYNQIFDTYATDMLITGGTAKISNKQITRADQYYFYITTNTALIPTYSSDIFQITQAPSSLTATASVSTISTYFTFAITFTLYSTGTQQLTSSYSIGLSENPTLNQADFYVTYPGATFSINVYFSTPGSRNIQVLPSYMEHDLAVFIPIVVTNSVIIVTILSPIDNFIAGTNLLFSLQVKDPEQKNYSTLTVNQISVVLTSSDATVNNLASFTSNGLSISAPASTYSRLVSTSGTYKITASGLGLENGYSNEFTARGILENINLVSNIASPTINDNVRITVTLTDHNNRLYNLAADVILYSTQSNYITGLGTKTTATGTVVFDLKFSTVNTYTIQVVSSSCTNSMNLVVTDPPRLLMSINTIPLVSATIFNVNVQAKLVNAVSGVRVTLQLLCQENAVCSGNKLNKLLDALDTVNGFVQYSGLQIYSSGSFYLRATSPGYQAAQIILTDFKNDVKEFITTQTSNPTVNFKNSIPFSIVGLDDLPFILPITVTLSEVNNYEFSGDKVLVLTKSSFNLAIQFLFPVIYDIVLSVSNSLVVHHFKFDVKPMLVKFIDPFTLSYGLGSTVPIALAVYDYTGAVLETQGQYTFEVLVTPPQIFIPSVITVSSGKGSISSLITFPGLFTFSLVPSVKCTVHPGSPILVYDTVYKILYNLQDLKQISNKLFLFNITLLNYNAKPFDYSNSITFTCSDDSGRSVDTPIKTTTSEASLPLYFLSEGTKFCTIKASNGTSLDLTFIVDPSIRNPDEKCAASISSDVCGKCVPQAVLIDGKCSCIQYSKFNSNTKACECDAGLNVNNGICSTCGNYFRISELSAYYTQDFKSIVVEFSRPVNQNLVVDCNEFITLPGTLRMYTFACSWYNAKKLEIQFNRVIPTLDSAISINPRYVQAAGNVCLFDIIYLSVSAQVVYQKPVPVAKIEGITSVSLKCNTDGVTVKSKFITPDYLYQWSVQSSSQALTDYAESQQSSTLTIATNLLVAGAMKISLRVTSSLYQTSATDVFIVNVLNNEALSVSITAGSLLSVRPSESVILKASVDESCRNSGPYSYKWTYSAWPSDSEFNFGAMTNKDNNVMTLSIQSHCMRKGISYTFKVTVVNGNLSGSASTIINVVSTDLVVNIERSSGTVGTQTDLLIPANVIDPDNECTKADISWFWACTQDGKQCLDSGENNLIVPSESMDLLIQKSKLVDGAFYHFSLSVSCKYKDSAVIESVDIQIDSEKNGDIKLRGFYEIRSTEDLIIIPQLKSIDNPKFLWTVYPQVSGLDVNKATLYFPPNALTPGSTYRATLTMYSKSTDDGISAYTNALVQAIPKCQKLVITNVSSAKFKYDVINCENDDPRNQIRFSFGYTHEDSIVWVTKFISQNPITLLIKDEKGKGVAKVCYSDDSCSIFTTKIPKSTSRSLSVDQSLLDKNTYDPDYFASLLIFYSADITKNEEFTYFYNQYLEFFLNTSVDEQVLYVFLDSTISLFANPYALARNNKEELAIADNILVNLLQNYTSLIADIQIKKILEILDIEINERDSQTAMKILELITKINFFQKPIGYEISMHSNKISVFRKRNLASEFLNKTINYVSDTIIIVDLPLDDKGVFDLFYAKYLQSDTNFDLSFYQIGSYSTFNYNRSDTEVLVSFTLSDSIGFTVAGSFNTDKIYKCVHFKGDQWVSGGCNIVSISSIHASVTLDHLSSFRIEVEDNCGVGTGPIATMILLVAIIVTLGMALHLHDKKKETTKLDFNSFLIYYPLTSLFYYQPNSRRSIVVFQLLSSELLILTLIGAFHYHFDSPEKDTENRFSNYYGKQLFKGAAGWALAQVFIIPIFWLSAVTLSRKGMRVITVPIMTMVTVGCVIGVSIMGATYCGGWSEYWIINFLIFLGVDLSSTELIYALLLPYVYQKPKEAYEFTAAIQIESAENQEKVVDPSHESENLQVHPYIDGGASSNIRSRNHVRMHIKDMD